jgi:periplasmic divalent cation tolerance protein
MTDVMMVISTFPDIETARQIGTVLIERQLAACVNLVGRVASLKRTPKRIPDWENEAPLPHK